jgi:hypothetical protein
VFFFGGGRGVNGQGMTDPSSAEVKNEWSRTCTAPLRLLAMGRDNFVVCFHGRPRQATDVLQPAGLLYRPIWTFQLWPPDAPAPIDAFRTLAAEVGTYGRE